MAAFRSPDRRDPIVLLERVRHRASERQLHLFACGCARRVWPLLTDPRSRYAVEVAERYVDGRATPAERDKASRAAFGAYAEAPSVVSLPHLYGALAAPEASAAAIAYTAISGGAAYAALLTTHLPGLQERESLPLSLLDDIFGKPTAPITLQPAWLAWEEGTIARMARAIYDDNTFEHLPYLADALEEAGCEDPNILTHCRSGRTHVRGCWVVDLILGQA